MSAGNFRQPLAHRLPRIRFNAGAPLLTPGGHDLGSLCVIDNAPRTLNPAETSALDALVALARQNAIQLERRRTSRERASSAENIKTISRLLPMCSFCKGIRDLEGHQEEVETCIRSRTQTNFTQGVCPKSFDKHSPETP